MGTQFTTFLHNITDENLSDYFDGDIKGVEDGFCPYEESDRKCRAEHKCINQVAK